MAELLPWHQSQWTQLMRARAEGRLPHALAFVGPQGIGKLMFAQLLAQSMLCHQPDDLGMPCGVCHSCRLLASGNSPNCFLIQPEEAGKAIKVDAIRDLIAGSVLAVGAESARIFIIEPADAMGIAAYNALLKTLEEPIPGTLLILISAKPASLPATIRSRCQNLAFALPDVAQARSWLQQSSALPPDQVQALLGMAGGAPLTAFIAHQQGALQPYMQVLTDFLGFNSNTSPVQMADKWLKQVAWPQLLGYMIAWVQDLLRAAQGSQYLRMIPESHANDLKNKQNQIDSLALHGFLGKLEEAKRALVNNLNPTLALEGLLIQWLNMQSRSKGV